MSFRTARLSFRDTRVTALQRPFPRRPRRAIRRTFASVLGVLAADDGEVLGRLRMHALAPIMANRMVARKETRRSKKSASPRPTRRVSSAPRREQAGRDAAIDEYLARVSPKQRALLRELRLRIHALVPAVEECISYRLPAFRYEGRVIAGFSATSNGCSYYPFSGTTLKTLARDIEGYSQTKSALHFGPEKPLPAVLVRKLLEARIAEG
jgi:uncharacterized protein YdhG (YjbR/CyaY superfamily)